jgi:hypothetical protein
MDGCITIIAYNNWRKQYEQTSYCIEFWAHKVVIPTECQLNAYECNFDYDPYMKIYQKGGKLDTQMLEILKSSEVPILHSQILLRATT